MTPTSRSRRIFWLGMHKVLKPTELRRLRELGHEVFNPAYISPIYDQSADLRIDREQPTTLPRDVFNSLLGYDFFYKTIDPNIARLLNEHFDVVIVTINPNWLKSFLDVFQGQIIYRTYGQHFSISETMIADGMWQSILSRDNLTIVPFAAESVETEHRWFVDLCSEPVPYQISDDVFGHALWDFDDCAREIAVSLPNIQNAYYSAAYERFSGAFPESYFRLYGPQRHAPEDERIIGELPREDFLERLRRSAGYYYDFRDDVAYLPPIEMMEMRGPVLCAAGSLLARFLGEDSPNVCADDDEAREKLRRLVNGDRAFAADLIASQETTRQRYDPAFVVPIFDRVMSGLLDGSPKPAKLRKVGPVLEAAGVDRREKTIAVALHADGLFEHKAGRPYAFEGIPRVVDTLVKTLTNEPNVACEVSCTRQSAPVIYDFFREQFATGAVRLYLIDAPQGRDSPGALLQRLAWVDAVDEQSDITTVVAPHYYLFPELILSETRLVLYLPDYFPYLAPGEVFDETVEKDARNKQVGLALASRADRILTNSEFTRAYLPKAGFSSHRDDPKVVVAPLPFLGADRALDLTREEQNLVLMRLAGRPFLFYPTANRPNKNLKCLFEAFSRLRLARPDLGLAMTCDLYSYPPAAEAAKRLGLLDDIHLFPRASEGLLRWFYQNSVALCLTSNLEGNFPPQVLEALNYGAPVVATRLPMITEVLGDMSDQLLLVSPNDAAGFANAVEVVFRSREMILRKQDSVVVYLRERTSLARFASRMQDVFTEMLPASEAI